MTAPVSVRPRQSKQQAAHDNGARPGRRRHQLTVRPCGVVAAWAALLGALVAASAGFGNNALVLEVSGSSAGFVLLLAGAVWLDRRLHPGRGWLPQPTRVGGVVMLAVAIALAWLGSAFGAWLMIIAGVPFLAAVGLEILARRHRKDLRVAAGTTAPRRPGQDRAAADTRGPGTAAAPGGGDREAALGGARR